MYDRDVLAVILSFGLYALYVLIPTIPAILIYLLFPDSKVNVSGPLGKLTIKAKGAFAAYIVTVFLGFFLIKNTHHQITDIAHPTWTIIGYVNKEAVGDLDDILVKNLPPSPAVTTDASGEFRLEGVEIALSRGGIKAEIKAESEGYVPKSIVIDGKNSDICQNRKEIRLTEPINLVKTFK